MHGPIVVGEETRNLLWEDASSMNCKLTAGTKREFYNIRQVTRVGGLQR